MNQIEIRRRKAISKHAKIVNVSEINLFVKQCESPLIFVQDDESGSGREMWSRPSQDSDKLYMSVGGGDVIEVGHPTPNKISEQDDPRLVFVFCFAFMTYDLKFFLIVIIGYLILSHPVGSFFIECEIDL